jgi:hypothetical protein
MYEDELLDEEMSNNYQQIQEYPQELKPEINNLESIE